MITYTKLTQTLGVSSDTIRYYERLRLAENQLCLVNKYRSYSQETKNHFLFIKWAKAIGFTLKKIKRMLNIKHASLGTCEMIKVQSTGRIDVINKKALKLKKLKKSLKKLVLTCEKTPKNEYPILEDQCK